MCGFFFHTGLETRVDNKLSAVIPYLSSFSIECRHNYFGRDDGFWPFLVKDYFRWYKNNKAFYKLAYEGKGAGWVSTQLDKKLKLKFSTNPSPVIELQAVTSDYEGIYRCDFTYLLRMLKEKSVYQRILATTTVDIYIGGKSLYYWNCYVFVIRNELALWLRFWLDHPARSLEHI